MQVRRRVLGDAHVDRAEAAMSDLDKPFQVLITEAAWGTVWASDAISPRERSMLTLAILAGTGNHEEIAMHLRATARTGASPRDVMEAFQHVAIYAGVPRANTAIRIAKAVFAEWRRTMADSAPIDLGPLIPRNRAIHPVPYDPDYKTSVTRSPNLPLLSMDSTPTEETGPASGTTLIGPLDNNLILNWTKGEAPAVGERILVHGRVLDQLGRPVPGVAGRDLAGQCRRALPACEGRLPRAARPQFRRLRADDDRRGGALRVPDHPPRRLSLAEPGQRLAADAHPLLGLRTGFGQRLITQMYFEGDPLIARCPIAHTVKDRGQLDRLVAPLDMAHARPHGLPRLQVRHRAARAGGRRCSRTGWRGCDGAEARLAGRDASQTGGPTSTSAASRPSPGSRASTPRTSANAHRGGRAGARSSRSPARSTTAPAGRCATR
jgi:protocatechuate 3,4-dioxygenase, beta subunit